MLVVLLALVPYLSSLGFGFLPEWDDGPFVTANPRIALTPANLSFAFTSNLQSVYTPLTTVSLMVDHACWGDNPVGYHAVNLLFFGGCALLLFLIMRRLHIPLWSSLLLTLLWSWNPAKCESICWISERKGLASGFFAFAAFYLFLNEVRRGRWGWRSALLTPIAVLFKPWALPLPGVMLVTSLVLRRRNLRVALRAALPSLLTGIAAATMVTLTTFRELGSHQRLPVAEALINLFRYLGDSLFPLSLNPIQPRPAPAQLLWLLLPGILIAGLALWITFRGRLPRRISFGFLLAYLGTSLPVLTSGAFTNAVYADRYNFILSAIFWCWIGAAALPEARLDSGRRRLAVVAAALLLGGYFVVTLNYQWTFSDSRRLFTRAISGSPVPVPKAMEGLALTGVNRRDPEIIFEAAQTFLSLPEKRPPLEAAACVSTGSLLEMVAVTMLYPDQGGSMLAARLLADRNEILYSPEIFLPFAFNTAVAARLSAGKQDEAVALLNKQLQNQVGDECTLAFASGLAGYLSGDIERARREWQRAAELRPDDERIRKNLEITGVTLP